MRKGVIMHCIRCGSEATRNDGQTRLGGQRWRCNGCGRRFTARSRLAFTRHGFPDDVIALAVRHSVRYRLSYADVVNGWLSAAWPLTAARSIGGSSASCRASRWPPAPIDKQSVANGAWMRPIVVCMGQWVYLYRAIVVDVYCSARRNAAAARTFF